MEINVAFKTVVICTKGKNSQVSYSKCHISKSLLLCTVIFGSLLHVGKILCSLLFLTHLDSKLLYTIIPFNSWLLLSMIVCIPFPPSCLFNYCTVLLNLYLSSKLPYFSSLYQYIFYLLIFKFSYIIPSIHTTFNMQYT
jgi:hypothetical protein